MLHMAQVTKIHAGKSPPRYHYIAEWAARRGMRQADLVRELAGVSKIDKGTVSRWFKGKTMPSPQHLLILASVLDVDEVATLFRHPDDDWMAKLLRGRSKEDLSKIIQAIEIIAPMRTGTDG